ncbi:NAD-dependent epimerase/dehydratase family protein [Oryzibacter oryziterrae]|uniref:NAD-dependent epimerase/dehydratase family protein n=1 Tax=Oryzibacter oryziterrae TaxID=2766474 RepID=UPI001F013048|nr:NAD-dependent epimerase/dehydratase family protein [Oryzibacter oryziterrae]
MAGRILVLGALGGVGGAVARAFHEAGWQVSGLVRPGRGGELPSFCRAVEADVFDAAAVVAASSPQDVVFNGLNVPYHRWREMAMPIQRAALEVMARLGALHLFPGNVYNFGAGMPERLTTDVVFRPTSEKGRIRVEMEAMFAAAARDGRLRTVVLRAGDFFGPGAERSWVGQLVAAKLKAGILQAPGAAETVHAYAYLPDLARAFVALADARERLTPPFEVFHFEGHNVSFRDMTQAAERQLGRSVKVRRFPRLLMTLAGLFNTQIRAAGEMMYLWDVPHALVDRRMGELIGTLPKTELGVALLA